MMNNEYLWNRTGGDAEIEALEDALNTYRNKEAAAPDLPAKVFALPERGPRRLFKLGFAFAGTAFAAVILTIVWFQLPGNPAEREDSQNITTAQADSAVNHDEIFPSRKIEAPAPVAKHNYVRVSETNHVTIRPVRTVAQKTKSADPPVKLTKDEEYAYDQLMLALSITSSKLKIVKDKLDGIDEQNAAAQTRR
jgi:hypothetical protein